jgi:hypothetical protein
MAQDLQAKRLAIGDAIDYTPGTAVVAGQVVVRGTRLVCVASQAIAANVKGSLDTKGRFRVVKKEESFSAGDALYWDDDGNPYDGTEGTGALTATSSAGPFAGWCITDAASDDEVVDMILKSLEDAAAESLGLADLSDISTAMTYTAGRILVADGDSFEDVAVSGDATLASTGALTIANEAVTAAKMADLAQGSLLVGAASDRPTALDAKTSGQILVGDGTDLKSVAVSGDATLASTGALTLATVVAGKGGTGATTLTDHGVLVGSGTDPVTPLSVGSNGQLLIGQTGADPAFTSASGDVTIDQTGATTLNAAHQEQVVLVPVATLGADADLTATVHFAHPRACTLVSVGFLAVGTDFGTVDDGNTSVFDVTDAAANAIVSKTYNTGTQPTGNAINDLGALSETHKVLTAGEVVKLAITNGSSAKTPAGFLVVRFIPTNA